MKKKRNRTLVAEVFAVALLAWVVTNAGVVPQLTATASPAESAADYFKGKTIELAYCGSPGGGYHLWSRLIGKYLEKYTGANVVAITKNAAGGAEGIHYTYTIKGKGFFTICLSRGPSQVFTEAMGFPGLDIRWDSRKFNYIGRITQDVNAFHLTPKKFKNIDDLRAAQEVKIGTDSPFGSVNMHSTMYLEGLGLKNAKVILGYRGSRGRALATMQGEIDGCSGSYDSNVRYYEAGQLLPFCVLAKERYEKAPDVPTIWELGVAKEAEKWIRWSEAIDAVGRVILAPPDAPKDRVEFLQNVLAKIAADADFLADVKKAKITVQYLPAVETKKLVLEAVQLSPEEAQELKHIFSKKWIK